MLPRQRLALGTFITSLATSVTTHAATQCINENAPAPLEICVQDSAAPGVWVDQPNGRIHQYFGGHSWGSSFALQGTDTSARYHTGYFSGTLVTPVSNTRSGTGTAADPFVITTVADLGTSGVRFTQRFTYVNGDRNFRKAWRMENLGTTTFNDVRFFHGGDTFFGGDDSARSWYDADLRMVYVNNSGFSNSGYMGFYANPLTPFARYFSGSYWAGKSQTISGELDNTSDSNFLDAGYYLQWNRTTLAPGQSWNIEAFETWSPPGSLQVLTPAAEYVPPGTTIRKTFKVHNLSDTTPLSVTLSASTASGWTTTLPTASSLALAPLEVADVLVDVQVPSVAAAGTNEAVELHVTDGALNVMKGTTRLLIPGIDYTFSSESLNFGSVSANAQAEQTITLTAGSTALSVGRVTVATPFSLTNDTCSDATVAAGASCTITVRFAPTAEAEYSDTLSIPVTADTLIGHRIDLFGVSVDAVTVTASAGPGGTIAPLTIAVPSGEQVAFTLSPETGYRIDDVTGCDGTLSGSTYTTNAINSACAVNAAFARIEYAISIAVTSGGSLVSTAGAPRHGEPATFTVTPQTGYSIGNVTGCGGALSGSSYTIAEVTGDCAISASFTRNEYPVSVSATAGGAITATGSAPHYGERATIVITPDYGYSIDAVTGCGGTLNGNTYTTAPMSGMCSVNATFKPAISDAVVSGKGKGGGGAFNGAALLGLLLAAIARMRRGAAVATLGAAAATSAHAADADTNGWYVGGSFAEARSSERSGDITRTLQQQGYEVTAHIDDDRSAWRLHGGWSLNEYLSFEAGYSDLGDVATSYDGTLTVLSVDAFLQDAVATHPRSADGFDASVIGRYGFGDRFGVRGQLGIFRWEAERHVSATDGRTVSQKDNGTDLLWGAGFDVRLSSNLQLIAGWTRYELDRAHVETLSLGAQYRW